MIETDRSIHPSVLTIRMNRPDKRNALDRALVDALTVALSKAEADDSVRTVVLTGDEKAFSAGADLAALQQLGTATFAENLEDSKALRDLFEAIRRLPKPVIAAVSGHAIAGGCGLAAVCDFSVAARGIKLGFTEVRIGFVPALVSVYLFDRLGETRLRDLLLTGRLFGADEALQYGLVSRVVEREDMRETVSRLAIDLSRECSADSLSRTKELLRQVSAMHSDAALDFAARLNASSRTTKDCRAGVAAFLNRQPFPWQQAFDSATDASDATAGTDATV